MDVFTKFINPCFRVWQQRKKKRFWVSDKLCQGQTKPLKWYAHIIVLVTFMKKIGKYRWCSKITDIEPIPLLRKEVLKGAFVEFCKKFLSNTCEHLLLNHLNLFSKLFPFYLKKIACLVNISSNEKTFTVFIFQVYQLLLGILMKNWKIIDGPR